MINRVKIIETAKKYIGIKEGSAAHKRLVNYYNKVKPDGYTAKITDDWCAIAITAWCVEAYGAKIAKSRFPLNASCPRMITKAKLMHIWQERDELIPAPGDFILYDWQDSGKGDNRGTPDHVGLVTSCNGKIIKVVEGNKSNAVGIREIPVNAKYIRGYVTPEYMYYNDRIDRLAREVLAGKYGNGKARKDALGADYEEVQKRVNEILKEGR